MSLRAGKSSKIYLRRHKMEDLLGFILGRVIRRQPFIISSGPDRMLRASAVTQSRSFSSETVQVPPQKWYYWAGTKRGLCRFAKPLFKNVLLT